MKFLWQLIVGFFRFWYDFLVGDCWQIACGVLCIFGVLALALHCGLIIPAVHDNELTHPWVPFVAGGASLALMLLSVFLEFKAKVRKR
jgi:hypothetical protein